MTTLPLHLFSGFGVELEYMIVDRDTLAVTSAADRLLEAAAGVAAASDHEDGAIAWSNELVNHVVELKTNGPAPALDGLEDTFAASIRRIEELLRPLGARLMPTAMHPWMDPAAEARLWPHEYGEVYRAFDRIFDCKGHGWSNLQSVHLNLPFADDDEFARLHAAVRLLLPILPALAASSPFREGKATGLLDTRLDVYRRNCARVPSVTGWVIPEPVFTRADYEREIFHRMWADIAPHDEEEILREEWLNARGAIARFARGTIEIRVLDIQECPRADLAICRLIVAVLRALVAERWSSLASQKAWPVAPLYDLLLRTIRDADRAEIANRDYLRALGFRESGRSTAGELWRHLAAETGMERDTSLAIILSAGPLARRIVAAAGAAPDRGRLVEVYRRLCDCLTAGELFTGI